MPLQGWKEWPKVSDVVINVYQSIDATGLEKRIVSIENQVAQLRDEIAGLKADAAAEKAEVDAKLAALQDKLTSGSLSLAEAISEIQGVRETVRGIVADEPGPEPAPE